MSDVESNETMVATRLMRYPLVAIVRAADPESALAQSLRVIDGGVSVLEVSLTTPGALDVIAELADCHGDHVSIGAGTVLTEKQVREVASARATFMVAPNFDERVVREAKALGLAAFPGCFTPSEMVRATECGADAVKIFPANLWTPGALRGILEPLPDLRCVPTGGIDARNARAWLDAGAFALGVAGGLATDDPRAAAAELLDVIGEERNVR